MYYENQEAKNFIEDQRINNLPKRIMQITEVDLNGMRSMGKNH